MVRQNNYRMYIFNQTDLYYFTGTERTCFTPAPMHYFSVDGI